MDKIKKNIKLLIFLEDNNEVKNKKVLILEETNIGVLFCFVDEEENRIGVETFIPWARILKVKEITE